MYLLQGFSLRVQAVDVRVQERNQGLTDLGTDGKLTLACLDSWHQKAKNGCHPGWTVKLVEHYQHTRFPSVCQTY